MADTETAPAAVAAEEPKVEETAARAPEEAPVDEKPAAEEAAAPPPPAAVKEDKPSSPPPAPQEVEKRQEEASAPEAPPAAEESPAPAPVPVQRAPAPAPMPAPMPVHVQAPAPAPAFMPVAKPRPVDDEDCKPRARPVVKAPAAKRVATHASAVPDNQGPLPSTGKRQRKAPTRYNDYVNTDEVPDPEPEKDKMREALLRENAGAAAYGARPAYQTAGAGYAQPNAAYSQQQYGAYAAQVQGYPQAQAFNYGQVYDQSALLRTQQGVGAGQSLTQQQLLHLQATNPQAYYMLLNQAGLFKPGGQ